MLSYRKAEAAHVNYQLYGYGDKPASWDVLRDGVLVARVRGLRQSYGPRAGYRVEYVDGRRPEYFGTLRRAKARLAREFEAA